MNVNSIANMVETKKQELKYYSLTNILSKNAQYNIIFGERSNGKTYAILKHIIEEYCKTGHQGALVRRWKEDFRGKRGAQLFDAFANGDMIAQLTNHKYTTIYSYAGKWHLAYKDPITNKLVADEKPFCFGFALSDMEHDKSNSYTNVKTIFFDEFLTRQYYLPDEFVTFMNVVSTIVRQRTDVTIFMAGNTVNQYCPYFTEMGLTHIKDMTKGSIEVYKYGESKLRVAVEYADSLTKQGKPSDIYFAFDNPKLSMITGGTWEMAMYPHLPYKYKPQDIVFKYFMKFNDELLQCEIVNINSTVFTYIHRKTTPIQNDNKDFIFSFEYDPRPNHIRNIRKSHNKISRKLGEFFAENRVFYQDNEVGEIVRNYLVQCNHDVIV